MHRYNGGGQFRVRSPIAVVWHLTMQMVWYWLTSDTCAGRFGRCGTAIELPVHVVHPEDTAWSIANVHGVSLEDVMAVNKSKDWHAMRPGDSVYLPADSQIVWSAFCSSFVGIFETLSKRKLSMVAAVNLLIFELQHLFWTTMKPYSRQK